MAHTFISNRKNTSAVIHFATSNSSLVIAGNSSVSNVAISDETLTGAYITQLVWGCDGVGHIQIFRGPTLAIVLDSTGQHEYAGCGMPITIGQTANLDVKFVGSANSFVTLEVQKVGDFTSEYMQN